MQQDLYIVLALLDKGIIPFGKCFIIPERFPVLAVQFLYLRLFLFLAAGFVGGVVVLTEGLKGLFPNMKGWVTQLVSWCVGLVCAMLLWWLDAGFVSDVSWDIALLYGFGASLVANGVADTGLVQWVIGLFRKKREEAE